MIIGTAGYARSGKNTVGDILSEHGFEQRAFADKIREALVALNPILEGSYSFNDPLWLSEVLEKVDGWDEIKGSDWGYDARRLMQRMGTEVGRELFGETFWIDQCLGDLFYGTFMGESRRLTKLVRDENYYTDALIVVTDVRFPNEAQRIRDLGGHIWWIERGLQPVNGHPSDNSLSAADCDLVIDNRGTLEDLTHAVTEALGDQSP